MTMASFAMTHIANIDDLRENTEVCSQIDEAFNKSLVTKAQYETMERNLKEKNGAAKSDTLTELIFLSLGQQDRTHIELSVTKEYYCNTTYQNVFGEPEPLPEQK